MSGNILTQGVWKEDGTDITPKDSGTNVDIGTGGLKDDDVTTAIALGDAGNTSFDTTNKTVVGAVNENTTAIATIATGGTFAAGKNDPAVDAITVADVDNNIGVVITLTAAGNSQTLPTPTTVTNRHVFEVINNDTSTDPINIIGSSTVTLDPGKNVEFTWDGSAWIANDAAGLWLDDGTDLKAQNSTRNIDLQSGLLKIDGTSALEKGDLNLYDASLPLLTLTNTTPSNTEGSRASIINVRGYRDDGGSGELHVLAQIQVSHDGSGDDQKGVFIIRANDGNDGISPIEIFRVSGTGIVLTNNIEPKWTLQNTSQTDADGGRLSELIAYGNTLAGVNHMLGKMRYAHDGSGADQKGRWILSLNAGSDGTSPTDRLQVDSDGQMSLTGNLKVSGGQIVKRTATGAADYNPSALTTDYLIAVDNTAAPRAVTISTEDINSGSTDNPRVFVIKDESGGAGSNSITISGETGNIDGAGSAVINNNYGSRTVYADGTNLFIV